MERNTGRIHNDLQPGFINISCRTSPAIICGFRLTGESRSLPIGKTYTMVLGSTMMSFTSFCFTLFHLNSSR